MRKQAVILQIATVEINPVVTAPAESLRMDS